MKKALIIIIAIIMVAGGIYGVFHFYELHRAETEINRAILNINEGRQLDAVAVIKEVLAESRYRVVNAPALYLLADTYEHMGKYSSAEQTYGIILSDTSLKEFDNWWSSSVVSLSKLYRKGMVQASISQKKAMVMSIESAIKEVRSKEDSKGGNTIIRAIGRWIDNISTATFNINVEAPSDETVMRELKTELGYLLLGLGEYGRAEELFASVDSPVSRLGLAKLYLEKGEYEKGLLFLWGLLAYDTTGNIRRYYIKELYKYADLLYGKQKYHKALDVYEEIVKEAPDTEYAELSLYRMAKHFYNTHENGKALPHIEKLLTNSVSSRDEEALVLKGYIYYDNREFVRALKVFKEFIRRYPNSALLGTAIEWKVMTERSIKYLG